MKSIHILLFVALLACVSSCSIPGNPYANAPAGTPIPVSHARGFLLWHSHDGYEILLRNPQDTTEVYGIFRLSRNAFSERKDTPTAYDTIPIPVRRAALSSTTFIAYFDRIGAADAITGITYPERVRNANLLQLIESGHTKDITSSEGVDLERLLASEPDMLMAYAYGNSNFDKYRRLGIPVLVNMEYMESNPLARAEWVKVVGCLTDRLQQAMEVFGATERNYMAVREKAVQIVDQPLVFTGTKYGGIWFAPGNRSYIAQFIRDAGARYAFEHVEGQGNVELDFESVVSLIARADYWGLLVSSKGDFALSHVLEMEPAYVHINAFKKAQIFVCNTARNDYFGDAVMEPDLILGDMVAIIHPGLMPDHEPTYFFPVVVDIAF